MSEMPGEVERIARLMGRGRSESTPFWLHTSVFLVIAVVATVLVLVTLLVQQLV